MKIKVFYVAEFAHEVLEFCVDYRTSTRRCARAT